MCEPLPEAEDVIRFDHDQKDLRDLPPPPRAELYATDGNCTHANTHLADGLVKGKLIECPKHNGRFDFTDGSPERPPPLCVALEDLTRPASMNGRDIL